MTATAVHAQEARGTITGTVVDSSKGVIPGASVTITNVAMGTSVPVATNEIGWFQAPYLIPGTYRVTVELAGFKKFLREGIEVRVDDRLELELTLEVGVHDRDGHRHGRHAAARDDERVARAGGGCAARRGTADAAWRSVRPHRPRGRRVVHAAPRGSTAPSNRRTSSATRWMARASTEATSRSTACRAPRRRMPERSSRRTCRRRTSSSSSRCRPRRSMPASATPKAA